jgi:hypothetical protein
LADGSVIVDATVAGRFSRAMFYTPIMFRNDVAVIEHRGFDPVASLGARIAAGVMGRSKVCKILAFDLSG